MDRDLKLTARNIAENYLKDLNYEDYLKFKETWIEDLQTITRSNAIQEGLVSYEKLTEDGKKVSYKNYNFPGYVNRLPNPINSFKTLWSSIYGPQSWYNNPEVLVIEFEKISAEEWKDELKKGL